MKIKVKTNNVIFREQCAICGICEKIADVPYWAFTEENKAICSKCLGERDSILLEVLESANKYALGISNVDLDRIKIGDNYAEVREIEKEVSGFTNWYLKQKQDEGIPF